MMYVNEMYVIKSAVLSFQKGNTVSTSASISGASVISGSAAYDFSSSQIEQTEIDDTVVNVEGPTFTKDTMPFCNVVAVGAPAAQPAVPSVQSVVKLSNLSTNIKDTAGNNLQLQDFQLKTSVKAPQ
jgi:hypothetical protein